MPDWSYQTCFKPLLFRMPPRLAQQTAIGTLGWLGRTWLGRRVIQFMGHMVPDRSLTFAKQNCRFPARVGLAAGLDATGYALGAFNEFGFAFQEIGPLTKEPESEGGIQFDSHRGRIRLAQPEKNPGLASIPRLLELRRRQGLQTPLFFRFDESVTAEHLTTRQIQNLASPDSIGWVIPHSKFEELAPNCGSGVKLLLVPAEPSVNLVDTAILDACDGVMIDASIDNNEQALGRSMCASKFESTLQATVAWRRRLGAEKLLIACGGVTQPLDSLRLSRAGADIIGLDLGMVVAGPGLAKRSNELLAAELARSRKLPPEARQANQALAAKKPAIKKPATSDRTTEAPFNGELPSNEPATRQSWFWAWLMGVSMILGGVMAAIISMTRVVLPYDESLVGMTRLELSLVNDRLLAFMTHDRMTLAGTMICVGTLYSCLAWFGIRRGSHWAKMCVVWSAFVGFFSFFLFLGFGYFDPFHAFVSSILFQFLLLTVYSKLGGVAEQVVDPYNDHLWHRGLWGQLSYLGLGAVLVLAGSIICKIGVTTVFVPEDMEFMCTTSEKLIDANPQLLSLVAHDRATFGGMLVCSGIVVVMTTLWGFRRGHAWIWWMLLISGLFGFLPTIWVHHHVGYTSLTHLMPAYGGFIALVLSATLSYSYLHDRVRVEDLA